MIDVDAAREVALDILERSADVLELFEAQALQACRAWTFSGATAPPPGHPFRADFEAWAESAGCGDRRRGFPAPKFPDKDGRRVGLWHVAEGRWVDSPMGRKWAGEPVTFEDFYQEDRENAEAAADLLSRIVELRRFAASPPTGAELAEGWVPPSWIALEEHEYQILQGDDPETGLPAPVATWLRALIYPPKAEYARAYCAHRLLGDPAPADPGADWAVKARKRADHVIRTAVTS